MKKHSILVLVIVVMVVLHQDFWLWRNKSLVFGFLPVGLAYHVCYSMLASIVMTILVLFAWPKHLEQLDKEASDSHER